MTLSEAIRHAKEVAESCQLKAYDIERNDYKDLEECAAEHRQLAEWLNELKKQRRRMDNNETKRIQSAIRCIKLAVDIDPWTMEIAVEAMKKQIPKEPEYKEEDRFEKNYFVWYTYCPQCGFEINTGDSHCKWCGQAIDWEEGEE